MIKLFILSVKKAKNDFGQMGFYISEFQGNHLNFCLVTPDFELVSGLSF